MRTPSPELYRELRALGASVSVSREVNLVHTLMPESAWMFKYEDFGVACLYCGKSFPVGDLRDEVEEDEDGNLYSTKDNACPVCAAENCIGVVLTVEYESITDALKRRGTRGEVKDRN